MCAFIQFIVLFLSCMLVVMFEALRHTLSHLHARGAAPHVVRRLSCCRICFVGPRFDVQRVLGLGPWAQGLACRTSCSGLWSAARMLLRRLLARLPVLLWCPSSRVCCVCRSACVYPAALACYVPRPATTMTMSEFRSHVGILAMARMAARVVNVEFVCLAVHVCVSRRRTTFCSFPRHGSIGDAMWAPPRLSRTSER
jgi:hypothetical protein